MNDTFRLCRKCGKPIGVINERAYRKIIVDAEAVAVVPDQLGDIYIRVDGSKMRGRKAEMEESGMEYAYRPHHCHEV